MRLGNAKTHISGFKFIYESLMMQAPKHCCIFFCSFLIEIVIGPEMECALIRYNFPFLEFWR